MKYVITHNERIIDICDSYLNETVNGEDLVKVITDNSHYYIGTPDRNEYVYTEVESIPEDYNQGYSIDEETGEITNHFYYTFDSDNEEFIKVNC